ncbi:hypothetical protein AV274_2162 [Blastocystis sp. ATCC 50177/Nand II]|uniref:Uncharacterized protein n=1 Tax=Blastocystis sp. subtype 1 (strain ATCC 50177 / NandII) TaxID=478820 RepID=A0A196SIV7_BLAHN|nr:hypothetical protein AV274_2162 [Blastocystis sp. ATCC 50177/Nand II]
MSSLSFCLLLLSAAVSALTCSDGDVYVAITKKCTVYASEDSYRIWDGNTALISSSRFSNNEQRTDEYCLPATTNNQYSITMTDSSGDSWGDSRGGAWMSVAGVYGNVFFKNYMTERRDERFKLSLYYPIMKNQQWKMITSTMSLPRDWTLHNYPTSTWNDVTLGSVPAATGSQFFRKTFTGIAGMAAYEIRFNYRYGIVAYLNGLEIVRDHMPSGIVRATTASVGEYDHYDYHGVIRPSAEIEEPNSVLAVELHFPEAGEHAVEFDAFMAALASTAPVTEETKCFIYPYAVTLNSESVSNPNFIFNWGKADSPSVLSSSSSVEYAFQSVKPYINGLRHYNGAPTAFTWQGSNDGAAWMDLFGMENPQTYGLYTVVKGTPVGLFFNSYKYTFQSSRSLYEVQPMTCSHAMPFICSATAKLPEGNFGAVEYTDCGEKRMGSVQYTCVKEGNRGVWRKGEEECVTRVPPKASTFVFSTLKIANFNMDNSSIALPVVRRVLSEVLKIQEEDVVLIINRYTKARRLEDALLVDVRITTTPEARAHLVDLLSQSSEAISALLMEEDAILFPNPSTEVTLEADPVFETECDEGFMEVHFSRVSGDARCQVRLSDEAMKTNGLVLVDKFTA